MRRAAEPASCLAHGRDRAGPRGGHSVSGNKPARTSGKTPGSYPAFLNCWKSRPTAVCSASCAVGAILPPRADRCPLYAPPGKDERQAPGDGTVGHPSPRHWLGPCREPSPAPKTEDRSFRLAWRRAPRPNNGSGGPRSAARVRGSIPLTRQGATASRLALGSQANVDRAGGASERLSLREKNE